MQPAGDLLPLQPAISRSASSASASSTSKGWVGGSTSGFETRDGGRSWTAVNMGKAVNKIRILKTDRGATGYAIGVEVYKLVDG
jgi:hypothetical protein